MRARITNIETGATYQAASLQDCRDITDRQAYQALKTIGERAIQMGKTCVERLTDLPPYDDRRQGKCEPCKLRFVWHRKLMALRDAHCPHCGTKLERTLYYNKTLTESVQDPIRIHRAKKLQDQDPSQRRRQGVQDALRKAHGQQETLSPNDIIDITRQPGGAVKAIIILSNCPQDATRPLHHVVRHSPTGFNYGYAGSGPADLALSILAACVEQELADRYYQPFKFDRIAPEQSRHWAIKAQQVREWVGQRMEHDRENGACI